MMRRGTTPTLIFNVSGIKNIEIKSAFLTLRQRSATIEKNISDLTITEETVECMLTQSETLSLTAGADIEVQLRCLSKGGTAYASQIIRIPVERILKEGEIT